MAEFLSLVVDPVVLVVDPVVVAAPVMPVGRSVIGLISAVPDA
jgi:hypothetical protein